MNTATELSRPGLSPTVPMPRIRALPLASVPVDETRSDGASWLSERMSLAPEFCRLSADTALTAIGTSDSAWLRRVAVMTISPRDSSPSSAAADTAGVTEPAVVGEAAAAAALAEGATGGGAVSCAYPTAGIVNAQTEASQMLFMITPKDPRIAPRG